MYPTPPETDCPGSVRVMFYTPRFLLISCSFKFSFIVQCNNAIPVAKQRQKELVLAAGHRDTFDVFLHPTVPMLKRSRNDFVP